MTYFDLFFVFLLVSYFKVFEHMLRYQFWGFLGFLLSLESYQFWGFLGFLLSLESPNICVEIL